MNYLGTTERQYTSSVGRKLKRKVYCHGGLLRFLISWSEHSDNIIEQRNHFSRDEVQFFAAVVAHYVSDAQVPLHAISNYNGQLTGQSGLHFRFESDLLLRYQDRLKIRPAPIFPISNPRDFIFDSLLKGFLQADPILRADKKAVTNRPDYDEVYYDTFFAMAGSILADQLTASITAVASMITAAWEQAGKPDLVDHSPMGSKKRGRSGAEVRR